MERSEPTLVPQWLKNSGSLSGGGSISHPDDHATSRTATNKSFVNSNGRSNSTERAISSYFRRSSSSNSSGHLRSYSSFGKNRRDREWEKDTYDYRDKDKLVFSNGRHRDFCDPHQNTFSSKFENDMDGSRRSRSMTYGRHGDSLPMKVETDLSSHSGNRNNAVLSKDSPAGVVKKETIESDFSSLGDEERTSVPEVGRIPSPGLSSAFQSLPSGINAVLGGEKWTSALAEIPMLVGSKGTAVSSAQQTATSSPSSVTLGTTTSLNMAETVAQGPIRAHKAPQFFSGTQRLEELAIKQSRQLIPVTPSMPKTSTFPQVTTSSDKQRTKGGVLQHSVSSPLPVIHSPHGAPLKNHSFSKMSNVGKLHILNPVREKNGVTPNVKNTLCPTNCSKVVSSNTVAALNNPVSGRKPVLTVLEKRPTSQAKSRNDFFNLVRNKSMENSSSATENSSSVVEKSKLTGMEVVLAPSTPQAGDNSLSINLSGCFSSERSDENGDLEKCGCNGKKHPSSDPIFSEEEEAAFLRSLGWEENADEDGLTEEEITAFYRDVTKYIDSKPSLKILEPKFQLQLSFEAHTERINGVSAGLSSANAKVES